MLSPIQCDEINPAPLEWETLTFLPRMLLGLAKRDFRKGLSRAAGIYGKEIEIYIGQIPLVLNLRIPYERHLFLGLTDRHLLSAYRSALRQGDIAVDVGANIGFHSAYMANCVGSRGQIYSFEPAPDALQKLRKLCESNPLGNIEVISQAVSNAAHHVDFYLSENLALSSVLSDWDQGASKRRVEVEATTLDAFFESLRWPKIRLVKIDVEGYECQVFEGLQEALTKRVVEFYIFEVVPPGHHADHGRYPWLLQKLKTSGYRVMRFSGKKLVAITSEKDVAKAGPSFDLIAIRTCS